MLQIIPSTQVPEYQCKHKPVIQITHQFQTSDLEQLLRTAVQTLGVDEVRSIIGTSEPSGAYGYMVFVEGSNNPRHVHTSYNSARTEAMRLAQSTGRTAKVMKVIAEAHVHMQQPVVSMKEFR